MKPAVWVDGGSHAREWIAPAVATWMIHALVEGEKDLGLINNNFRKFLQFLHKHLHNHYE